MSPRDAASAWPLGGSELARLIRVNDWTATPLGPRETWPQSLRMLVDLILGSPTMMCLMWGPSALLLYNDAYADSIGEDHPGALGRSAFEVWPDMRGHFEPPFRRALAGDGTVLRDQHLPARLPGRPHEGWFDLTYTSVRDEGGQVAGVLVSLAETTERVLSDRALRESEARFRALAEQAVVGVCLTDRDQRFIYANETYARIVGRPVDDIVGRTAEELTAPEDWPHNKPLLERALSGGEPFVIEKRYLRPDGSAPWVRNSVSARRDESGQIVGGIAISMDVTDRREAEEALHGSEQRLRAIVETATDYAILTTDAEGRIETWLPGAQAVYGWTPEEAIGQSVDITFTPEDREKGEPERERRAAQENGHAPNVRWHMRKDGQRIFIDGIMRPLRDESGSISGFLYVGQDVTERRATEEALRESEARFRLMADAVPQIIWITDAEGRVEFFNRQWSDYTGGPALPPSAAYVAEHFVHPEDAAPTMAAFLEAQRTGGVFHVEHRIRSREGAYRWFLVRAEPHRDPEGGKILKWFGASIDIDDRKQAEARLYELNETLEQRVDAALAERKLFADVFEGTDAMISVVDPDMRLLAFNRAYAQEVERLGGHAPRLGDRVTDIYEGLPDLVAAAEANWTRAAAGEVFRVTQELGDPARYRRIYERRFEPLHDREGRLVGAYQYATDVTEALRDQRRAEEAEAARREADALYRAYFQSSGEALFVVGVLPDGGFTYEEVNPAHKTALGFDIAAVPGRRVEEVLPPEVAESVSANYRRVLETGELQRYRETAELGGRVIHAETVLVPVRDETGRIVRIVGSGRDMTAQVQAEEALRQSQKMEAMGQLTGGVAHDFNNLLTPILGGLDRLHRKGVGDERDHKLIEGALQSAERARTLVQRLLAFARRQPLQPRAVDVTEIVRGMADLVASTTGPQIKVAVDVAPDLPLALADANQLEMAILNLAVNARDAMPDGGTLRISVTQETVSSRRTSRGVAPGQYVRLSVADTGTGMDEATLARAVEPFFSTKGVGRGTGLGLSMVHGLAAQLGGALTIQSKPGLGTNVELWLPVAGAEAATGTAPSRSTENVVAPQVHGTALLIDDEPLVRVTAADMLAELGYSVVEAASADEALRRMDQGLAPDLVVTDHLMPGLTGTELARLLQARNPDLPVLIVSGYAEVDGIAPDLPRLTKPFFKAELAGILQRLKT